MFLKNNFFLLVIFSIVSVQFSMSEPVKPPVPEGAKFRIDGYSVGDPFKGEWFAVSDYGKWGQMQCRGLFGGSCYTWDWCTWWMALHTNEPNIDYGPDYNFVGYFDFLPVLNSLGEYN